MTESFLFGPWFRRRTPTCQCCPGADTHYIVELVDFNFDLVRGARSQPLHQPLRGGCAGIQHHGRLTRVHCLELQEVVGGSGETGPLDVQRGGRGRGDGDNVTVCREIQHQSSLLDPD